jgi:hypothetical protein
MSLTSNCNQNNFVWAKNKNKYIAKRQHQKKLELFVTSKKEEMTNRRYFPSCPNPAQQIPLGRSPRFYRTTASDLPRCKSVRKRKKAEMYQKV